MLKGAGLWKADLSEANLRYAHFPDRKFSLCSCKSLKGATMPGGQKYEERLKTPEGQKWLRFRDRNPWAYRGSREEDGGERGSS